MSNPAEEAKHCVSSGEKRLKCSLTRWKPDYNGAAEKFQQAAALYSQLKMRAEACDAWKKAVEAHRKCFQDCDAARCFEKMAAFLSSAFSKDLNGDGTGEVSATLAESVAALEEASVLFRAEQPRTSVDVLHRAVDMVERVLSQDTKNRRVLTDLDSTIPPNPLYEEYCRIVRVTLALYHQFANRDDIFPHRVPSLIHRCALRHIWSGELLRAASLKKHLLGCPLVWVRNAAGSATNSLETKISDENVEAYEPELNFFKRLKQPSNAAKTGLEVVILILYEQKQRVERANEEFQRLCKVDGFRDSQEQYNLSMLLSAMEERNEDQIQEVLKDSQCFGFIDATIGRMAQSFATVRTAHKSKNRATSQATHQDVNQWIQTAVPSCAAPTLDESPSVAMDEEAVREGAAHAEVHEAMTFHSPPPPADSWMSPCPPPPVPDEGTAKEEAELEFGDSIL